MSRHTHPWHRWPWPKIRLQILERDGYLCQIKGERCTGLATQVDHRVSPMDDPARAWDPHNLRAACRSCNLSRPRTAAQLAHYPPHQRRRRYSARSSRDW